jgi:hypothetical protein
MRVESPRADRGNDDRLSRSHRVRVVDQVPRVRAHRTAPPAPQVEQAEPERMHNYSTHWGRPDAADAAALRGIPAIGPGVSGAIKGSEPGRNLR